MKAVGLRELKNRLAEYVREVRGGETLLVTDRGRVVAEVRPPTRDALDDRVPAALHELARRGLVRLNSARPLYARFNRPAQAGLASRLLDEERGPR